MRAEHLEAVPKLWHRAALLLTGDRKFGHEATILSKQLLSSWCWQEPPAFLNVGLQMSGIEAEEPGLLRWEAQAPIRLAQG